MLSHIELLENNIRNYQSEAIEAKKQAQEKQDALKEHRKTMSFWDLNLWGFFGNAEKVGKYQTLKALTADFNAMATFATRTAEECDDLVEEQIESHLREKDPCYQSLLLPITAATNLRKDINLLLNTIHAAIEETGAAYTLQDENVVEALNDVTTAALSFQESCKKYNAAIQPCNIDGVTLSPIAFTAPPDLAAFIDLNQAENDLGNLYESLSDLQYALNDRASQARNTAQVYKSKARSACRPPAL